MAHRGRLAVLAHNLGRSVESIMAEFEGAKALERVKAMAAIPHGGTGDVKYHHGAEGLFTTRRRRAIKIRLYPNPSHLEFVDPVVTGGARAAQTSHSGPSLHHNPERRRAAAAARRRRLPGPGRGRRDAQPAVARGLLDRRHRSTSSPTTRWASPPIPRRVARPPTPSDMAKGFNVPIIHVNADDVGGVHRGDPARDGVPRALEPRHRHRPDRLPPLRAQRDRRARLHAADDGGADQGAPAGLRDLRRAARQGGRGHARGRRDGEHRGHASELSAIHKELKAKMEAGEYEVGDLDPGRHRRARPHQEPGRRHRGLRAAPADPERGAPSGPGELHHPPQAPQAARPPHRGAARRAASSSGTPRRSRSPRCSPRAATSA